MWRNFNRLDGGRVIEIEFPKKRDCLGRRFRFVRFLEVKDAGELERTLNQIQNARIKLQANKPRFEKTCYENQQHRNIGNMTRGMVVVNAERQQKLTYADVVKGKAAENKEYGVRRGQFHGARRRDQATNSRASEQRKWRWKPKTRPQAWIGMEFNEKFYMEGVFFCKIRAMGCRLVLLEGHDYEDLKELVENGRDWLGHWLEEIKPWSPTMVATERFTWIKCLGLPLHAWKPKYFQSFGNLWGTFVSVDDSTSKKNPLDVARFLISTPIMEPISKCLSIKINGVMFRVKFSEESSNGLYVMSSDFKINEGCEKGEEYSMKGSEDTDLSMLGLEAEQNRGDEEEDDMAIRLEMQEINVQNEVRHTDVVASLAGDTSAIVMVGQLNGQEKSRLGTDEATEEEDSMTGRTIEKHEEAEENTSGGLEGLTRDLPEWATVLEGKKNKKKKRRVKPCQSVYLQTGGLGGFLMQKKKKGNRSMMEKMTQQVIFEADPTDSMADDSINDCNIQNCNKGIGVKSKIKYSKALWCCIKELGVSMKGDELLIIRKLEEMEQRDKERRKKDTATTPTGNQVFPNPP
ncbi:hypothetical protein SLEP1_g54845 [Rubroshorea leprosula]|uniref:DUF4283 domain-containing protein n=1 Tax=Rubroshorea leprosula TaxID=152421 RepID=A0AAV5MEV0_9ROSI|nr:hypothetical protein SLEP1_g54845 [Rubroshorea leprosula]